MSSSKKDSIQETPQQRALAEHAINQFADWKQRWLPVQKQLASKIQSMGKAGSQERLSAAGKATTDTAVQFQRGEGALEKTLTAQGARPGSSRFNLAVTGSGEDQAKAKGLGMVATDQQIDDAYIQGLSALAATGRGERAQVGDSLSRMASQSSAQAAADAEASLAERAGNAQVIGQVAGFGLQRAFAPNIPTATGTAGGYRPDDGTGRVFNNPSAYTPAG